MPRIPNRGEGQISAVVGAWAERADKASAKRAGAQGPTDAALDRSRGAPTAPGSWPIRYAPPMGAVRRVRSAKLATSVVGRRLAEFAPSLLGAEALLIDGLRAQPSAGNVRRSKASATAPPPSSGPSPGVPAWRSRAAPTRSSATSSATRCSDFLVSRAPTAACLWRQTRRN